MVLPRVEVVSMVHSFHLVVPELVVKYLCHIESLREAEPASRAGATILLNMLKCSSSESNYRYAIKTDTDKNKPLNELQCV